VVTVGNEFGKSLVSAICPGYTNIELLPMGLDTEYYRPVQPKSDSPEIKVIFCGRLVALKGPDIVVEVANALINKRGISKVKFNIVGDGEEFEKLQNLIRKYHLENYVNLLGVKTQDQIIDIMNDSDIFLLPGIVDVDGRAETQGLVIQEAQAMCIPVIVSDAGGMKYGVIDGVNGFIVKERDIETIVNKIEMLANDADLRNRMGNQAREYVVNEFDSRVLGGKLESLYKKQLGRVN